MNVWKRTVHRQNLCNNIRKMSVLVLREIDIAIFRKVRHGLVIFIRTQLKFTSFWRGDIVTPLLKIKYYNLYKYKFYAIWKYGYLANLTSIYCKWWTFVIPTKSNKYENLVDNNVLNAHRLYKFIAIFCRHNWLCHRIGSEVFPFLFLHAL